ncbi:PRC and DUF2382 domain-containing protein [Actinoplanes utahensis]|uniref:PRC and DUF2382 domain-containing protein n=1 Tax=Actinoplanes utahensis TaxID=1869 RepID=UPI0006903E37|nr:PRC and DUF2382 domain-containing protein [Actinoplanes utahensis]
MFTQRDIDRLQGIAVYDRAGHELGTVRQIYLDAETGDPLWVTVSTGTLSFQESFVPLLGARLDAGRLTVAADADQVRRAPLLDTGGPLEHQQAERLHDHYGTAPDDAMTRSEERLVASTTREPARRVRLRKYLVTEEQQVTVPVTREEVRLEEVPVDAPEEPAAGPVVLHAERPVVTTETVPVERVRLTKETVRDEQTVTGTVRQERIELDER